jgi:hypothetical protein
MACSNSEFNFWNLWIYFGHLVGLLGRGISPTQGLYLHRTAQHRKTQTHIHASSGIRTHDPNIRTVEHSRCLRPRGQWDRHGSFIMPNLWKGDAYSLRYIWYTRRFGSWLYSRLQAIGCHHATELYYFYFKINCEGWVRALDLQNTNHDASGTHQWLGGLVVSILAMYLKGPGWIQMSRDSSVGIALGYGLDDWGSRVRFPAGAGNFSHHHRVQNGSGVHPASYPMGTGCFFPGGKVAEAWGWPLTSI